MFFFGEAVWGWGGLAQAIFVWGIYVVNPSKKKMLCFLTNVYRWKTKSVDTLVNVLTFD